MKLKDWADKQGISYLTAWRWFKAGDPRLANAYQSDSGTIIVPDENDFLEQPVGTVQSNNDVISSVLKKTVELSKNNASIEDFAAWILSNFSLKPQSYSEGPKYSRVKPKSEEIQNHFKQFLKPKGEKPKPNMFVTNDEAALQELVEKSDDLTTRELVDEIQKIGAEAGAPVNPTDAPEVEDLMKDLSFALNTTNVGLYQNSMVNNVTTYGNITEGVVTRSVDLTPQPIDYTCSSPNYTFSNTNSTIGAFVSAAHNASANGIDVGQSFISHVGFQPTQKEVESPQKIATLADKPRRGRKSSKGKNQ